MSRKRIGTVKDDIKCSVDEKLGYVQLVGLKA